MHYAEYLDLFADVATEEGLHVRFMPKGEDAGPRSSNAPCTT